MIRNILAVLAVLLNFVWTLPALAQDENVIAGTTGAVYVMTNAAENKIVIYEREEDGSLKLEGMVATGGVGGGFSVPDFPPEDALGSQSPLLLSQDGKWLLAVNAGSDQISVMKVEGNNLSLNDIVSSMGDFPVSLTQHDNWVYVLNAGNGGSIAGFRLGPNGKLKRMDSVVRQLNANVPSPFFLHSPAQVAFNPAGDKLVVTVKGGLDPASRRIHIFNVGANGFASETPVTNAVPSTLPFGIAFDNVGHMFIAEPFGNANVPSMNNGAVSSYVINADNTLMPISASVPNGGTATCWIARTPNGQYLYTTNNGTSNISGYRVNGDGSLTFLGNRATGEEPVDLAISPDGRFLYNVNAGAGTVSGFTIDSATGNLTELEETGGLPALAGVVGIAVR